ncbi:creatininase family protein [Paenibacillus radicis (ex Gao et al. 2016)]|uniref:Creatininase n=1 Tax=Paenibacillus radicis (ex Gao et al. 2016) TaxID=1737354 RepID=A0A917H7J3_9BACL|nr:creatininase family protein [Paenibacillus radicis (ex Gao et al. 2016)]GGG69077.1 creatininase [Paenibacillus radicis (ex Gao et al. 2016)]
MFQRYEGTAWEQRFLPRLTSKQVRELPKEKALVILPVGAVEQHGPHLPIYTDTLIGEVTLTQTLERVSGDSEVWLLPPVSYGKSNEHTGLPGTISLSANTLKGVIMDIADSLHASGFRKLLLFNTHGGNIDLLNLVSREIRIRTGMMVFYLSPGSLDVAEDLMTAKELEYGIHGGDYETSIVMSVKPDWVQTEFLVKEFPDMSKYRFLTLEGKIRFGWKMADISVSGITGDATVATPEKGWIIQERIAELLSEALNELCQFEITDVLGGRPPQRANGDQS